MNRRTFLGKARNVAIVPLALALPASRATQPVVDLARQQQLAHFAQQGLISVSRFRELAGV